MDEADNDTRNASAAPSKPETIEATFRNGSLTAISVVVGFSLTFLIRWAGLPGVWERSDLFAVAAITLGCLSQILALGDMLRVGSLLLANYNRDVAIFLARRKSDGKRARSERGVAEQLPDRVR